MKNCIPCPVKLCASYKLQDLWYFSYLIQYFTPPHPLPLEKKMSSEGEMNKETAACSSTLPRRDTWKV